MLGTLLGEPLCTDPLALHLNTSGRFRGDSGLPRYCRMFPSLSATHELLVFCERARATPPLPLSLRFPPPPPPSLPSFHHLSRRRRSSSPTARFLAQSSLLRGLFAAANSTSGCCCRPVGRDPEPGKALIATLDHGGRFPRRLSSPNARRRIVPLSTVCATCRASSLAPLDRCFLVVRHTDCRRAQTRGPKSWRARLSHRPSSQYVCPKTSGPLKRLVLSLPCVRCSVRYRSLLPQPVGVLRGVSIHSREPRERDSRDSLELVTKLAPLQPYLT